MTPPTRLHRSTRHVANALGAAWQLPYRARVNSSILFRVGALRVGLAAAVCAAILSSGPAWARGDDVGRKALPSTQLHGQATQLLQRLGYGAALTGGGQSQQAELGLNDSAAHMQQQLRTGMGVGVTLPLSSLQAGVLPDIPQSRAKIQPRGLSSTNPAIAGLGGIPGQNSPYTSSGNAAGYRPYRLPPGVKKP